MEHRGHLCLTINDRAFVDDVGRAFVTFAENQRENHIDIVPRLPIFEQKIVVDNFRVVCLQIGNSYLHRFDRRINLLTIFYVTTKPNNIFTLTIFD